MKTLIIPCGGRSSRFPNMKPKWMLTHPKGSLMLFEGLREFPVGEFDRFIITIHKSHIETYQADLILQQASPWKFELCVLDEWTNGPAETVAKTISLMGVEGSIVIKDSDNLTSSSEIKEKLVGENFVVGVDIYTRKVAKPESKSYLVKDENDLLVEIIEKKIVSGMICAGVYGISSGKIFLENYTNCVAHMPNSEIFMSHVISYMVKVSNIPFHCVEADNFEDWGTVHEWQYTQRRYGTYFCDFDGVVVLNSGKYGEFNWDSEFKPIIENIQVLQKLSSEGAEIIITTARDELQKARIRELLLGYGINVKEIITNLHHSPRFLINDFAPTNPYPSATAINLPRNGSIEAYLELNQ